MPAGSSRSTRSTRLTFSKNRFQSRAASRGLCLREKVPIGMALDVLEEPGGVLAVLPGTDHLLGQAAQVLQKRQPQHNRDGPDFADGQRRHALVGLDKPQDVVLVQS